METLNGVAKWMESSNGVWSCAAAIIFVVSSIWSWRLGLAKLKGVHKLPIVRATVGTTWKAIALITFTVLFDRGVSRQAAIARHDASQSEITGDSIGNKHSGRAANDAGGKANESSIVVRDEAVAPAAHVVAKPIIVSGKASHNNQSFSQFKPAEIEGYVRCKACNQLGSFIQVGRRWQFIEADLAPEPIFMK
jgi:hypothetical protein